MADDTQAQRDSGSAGGLDGGPVTAEDTYRDFHAAFAVALTELPPCISPHTATSIEFVGRAVRLMRSPPASAKLSAMQGSAASAAQHQQQQQQHQGSAAGLAGAPPQQLLPHGDAMAYAAALRVLQEQPLLSEAALERTVEAIRADVASRLWQLLVVQSGLMEHLVAIKDYMLLAKGDFYQCFLTDAAKLLGGAKASASTNRELAVAWQSAASKTSAAEDPHLKLFSIVYDGDAEARRQAAAAASASEAAEMYDMWDDLKIQARLPWPLGVLVTGEHLARYNAVFQLLLRLKRVQLLLESAWQDIGRLFKFKKPDKDGQQQRQQQQWHRQQAGPELRQLLQLRQHMGHLVANLQVYLQLDVVEANFDILVQRVAAAQDFGEVEYAHGRFLAAITSQSLLSMRSVMNPLVAAFVEARQLAHLVRNHVAKHAGDTDPLQARFNAVDVKAIKAAFDAKATMFYTSLRARTLRVHDVAPYLGQLYQRLDFNAYLDGSMPWVKASSQRLQQPSPYKADRLRVQAAQQQERQQAQEKQAQQGQREQQQRRGLAATGLAAAGLG